MHVCLCVSKSDKNLAMLRKTEPLSTTNCSSFNVFSIVYSVHFIHSSHRPHACRQVRCKTKSYYDIVSDSTFFLLFLSPLSFVPVFVYVLQSLMP